MAGTCPIDDYEFILMIILLTGVTVDSAAISFHA